MASTPSQQSQQYLSRASPSPSSTGAPPSPKTVRTLRKYQSSQSLNVNQPLLTTQQFWQQQDQEQQQQQQEQQQKQKQKQERQERQQYQHQHQHHHHHQQHRYETLTLDRSTPQPMFHGRTRSNSDAGLASPRSPLPQPPRRSRPTSRKRPAKQSLEVAVRDGPQANVYDGLNNIRDSLLRGELEADLDGMSSLRIYIWLILLNAPPLSTDTYLSLVHRGPSPAYSKIRNDTFRTLATDPLFKRRVTESSLIRLLNAVAWQFHDIKREMLERRPRDPLLAYSRSSRSSPTRKHASSVTSTTSDGEANEPGIYMQGMNVLCAPFAYAARSEVEAFVAFSNLLTYECPGYVRGAMDGVHRGVELVDECLEIVDFKLYNYLLNKGMHARLYAFSSVLTLCACTPPLPEVLHLWDFLFAFGVHLNIVCIVAQLVSMRDAIFASSSPTNLLRSFPPLNAKRIKDLTVSLVQKLPDDVYARLVDHAK